MPHPRGLGLHRVCEDCWNAHMAIRPERVPFELADCCMCGAKRNLDIVVRVPASMVQCGEAAA